MWICETGPVNPWMQQHDDQVNTDEQTAGDERHHKPFWTRARYTRKHRNDITDDDGQMGEALKGEKYNSGVYDEKNEERDEYMSEVADEQTEETNEGEFSYHPSQ